MTGRSHPRGVNVHWTDNMRPNRLFKSPAELRQLYADYGIEGDADVITYCRIGEAPRWRDPRSHSCWVLDPVRNDDGFWVEWGDLLDMPIGHGA